DSILAVRSSIVEAPKLDGRVIQRRNDRVEHIAGNVDQLPSSCLRTFGDFLSDYDHPARYLPAQRLILDFRSSQSQTKRGPVADPHDLPLHMPGHAQDDRVGQAQSFQLVEKLLDEEARIGPQCVEPNVLWKPRQGFSQERTYSACCPRVATAQPGMQHEL